MKPGKKQSSEHAPPASWAATRQHLMLPLSFVLDPPREGEQNIQAPSISYLVSSALSSKVCWGDGRILDSDGGSPWVSLFSYFVAEGTC